MLCKYNNRKLQSTDYQLTAILRSCLGRTRTLTNGTRIRCATITPQGIVFRLKERLRLLVFAFLSLVQNLRSSLLRCKVTAFFWIDQIFLEDFFNFFCSSLA